MFCGVAKYKSDFPFFLFFKVPFVKEKKPGIKKIYILFEMFLKVVIKETLNIKKDAHEDVLNESYSN